MPRKPRPDPSEPILPRIPFAFCPIRASLGSLGRKWALLALRDIAFFRNVTFGRILRNNPGLTPRVLSMRLKDLREEGLIERLVEPEDGRDIRYRLTSKGDDIIPILTAFIQYGIRHHADRVFEDEKPRGLGVVFPEPRDVLLGDLGPYARGKRWPPRPARTRVVRVRQREKSPSEAGPRPRGRMAGKGAASPDEDGFTKS